MTSVQLLALAAAAVTGTLVALTRQVLHQTILFGAYGLVLALVFFVFHAPDAALAQAIASGAVLPLLVLVALAKISEEEP